MLEIKDIIILVIYGYFVFKVINPKDTMTLVLVTLAAMVFICHDISGFETNDFDLNKYLDESTINKNTVPGAKLFKDKFNLPYDGICLKTGNEEYWMKTPDKAPFVSDDKLYTYFASQSPLKTKLSDQSKLIGPPIDGVKGSPEKMFMWANNVSSPLCCPSTYSTSTGCLCTTKQQRDFIAARGTLNPIGTLTGLATDVVKEVKAEVNEAVDDNQAVDGA